MICPVCGYPGLEEPPLDFSICDSCGTEFGYDDAKLSHFQLRQRWIASGAQWWSQYDPSPPDWNAYAQMGKAGL